VTVEEFFELTNFMRRIFTPMAHRKTGRPDWQYVIVARAVVGGWTYLELARLVGGSPHTWSYRITEAERRGLLRRERGHSSLTEYARLLERSAPLADAIRYPHGAKQ
jgi:hypothetical protein